MTAALEVASWQWGMPAAWWLLLPVVLVLWWRAQQEPGVPLAGCDHGLAAGWRRRSGAPPWPRTWRARLWRLPSWLDGLAAVWFVAAIAEPIERHPAPPQPVGRDLVVCLDCSSSMAATDLAPGRTRFQISQELAAAFLAARPADRLGLVAFARFADLRCPPTYDHAAVRELLAAVPMVVAEGSEDATAIGAAVATAAAALQRLPAGKRVLVLVTDGEENVATALAPEEIAPLHAAQWCAAAGIRVHSIVVGRGQQQPDGSYLPLDTTAVRQLASTTGGRAFTAADAASLAAVYAAIDAMESEPPRSRGDVRTSWFPACVAVALGCFALSRALAAGWLRRLP